MIRPLSSLLALVIVATPMHGQADTAGSTVSFHVTRFDPDYGPSPEFKVGSGANPITLKINSTCIEGPIKATLRDEKFLDFRRGTTEQPELSVPIGATERQDLLLVMVPNRETLQVLKIHAPKSEFKGGDRYVVNATATHLAIQLGDSKPILIAPGKAGILASPGGSQAQILPVVINQRSGDEWRLISSEFMTCDPRFRTFLFVYKSPRTPHTLFHEVKERL